MNRKFVALFCSGSLLAAGIAFSQEANRGPHTPVSSDGSEVAPAAGEALRSSIAGSRGSGLRSIEALTAEGVEFEGESEAEFRRMAALPVPSRGGAQEVVIGADTRERTYTTTYPARAKVLITFTGGRCSGTMISRDTVSTAGHCVHTGGPGGAFRTSVVVYPGRDGTLSPFGSCTAKRLHTVVGWASSSNEEFDYGAIKLNCTVGNSTGFFGMTTADPLNTPAIVQGYPGDKPLQQWFGVDKVRAISSRQSFYQADTVGGVSGSGIWYDITTTVSGPYLTGIHAYGKHGSGNHAIYNHGVRLVSAIFNNLVAWKNAP